MNHRPARRARRASASPLFTPHGTDRASRKAARRQLAEATAKARAQASAHQSESTSAAHEMPTALYPANGRPGPASARHNRLKLPAHRMTTAVAAGAYPFLAEGGLGAEGIYIGRDVHAEASFVFDPFALYGKVEGFTNPNLLLAGVIGQGKSALAKSFALRSVAFGYRVYVPCDPKGEWTPVAQALGGRSVALGPGLPGRLNPLDAAPRPHSVSEDDWVGEIRKRRLLLLGSLARTVLGRDLMPMEHTALDVALDAVVTRAVHTGRTPLLGDVAATLNNPSALDEAAGMMSGQLGDAARDLAHAMRRLVHGDLAGMFDAPSTVAFDPNAPMLTIDLSRLGGSGDDTALVLAMTCASAWMESALSDPSGGRRWIVYDEAWRLMRHVGLLQRMQAQWKLSRGLGIANLMVIHRLSDLLTAGDAGSQGRALAEGLLADCSTRIIYRQETDQLHAAASLLGLTSVEMDAIAHLNRGRGLWKVAGRSFIVQHLLHAYELALFDTDARMHKKSRKRLMKPDIRRELIPRATTLHLIDALNAVRGKLSGAFEQWELLDDTGRVPASPSYTALLQHVTGAQTLARDVVQLTADFARTTSSTNRAGSAVLAHLASAVTLSSQAVPHFAETAQTALSPPRPHSENDSYVRDNRMVVEHATARACLRRAAQALGDAVQELTDHLDFHRFFLTPSHRQSPVPPPKPRGRHR